MQDARSEPEITVLITAHNEAERIESCLRAVMSQDYPMERVEVLLVDDRSTDGTVGRVRSMGLEPVRILQIKDHPVGLTSRQAALDLGFTQAKGEIVGDDFADSLSFSQL